MKSDPPAVLHEYALERLRAGLRTTATRVLEVRSVQDAAGGGGQPPGYGGAWLELGALEGPELDGLAVGLAHALRPGARLICVVARREAGRRWTRAFAPHVRWLRRRALGLLVPASPGWAERHPAAFALLAAAEHVLAPCWPFRGLGTWSVREGVRR